MSAAANLEAMFARASRASEDVMLERDEARTGAVIAIRRMEAKLRAAIAGDTLRGMANLHPVTGAIAQQAARILGREGAHTQFFDINDRKMNAVIVFGTRAVVVTKDGVLAVFSTSERGEFSSRPVRDDELSAQDLDAVAHTLHRVLERHIERAGRTAANYARLVELAAAICDAIR